MADGIQTPISVVSFAKETFLNDSWPWQEELPFGGIGPSGTGSYHGFQGFKNFSHAKSIYRQANINVGKLGGMLPPYGKATESTIKMQLKK